MKTLLIMRHAKSSWKDGSLPDVQRPLNKRGLRDAPRMGRLLREQNLVPQAVLSSTAERARQTVAAVAESAGFEAQVQYVDSLYGAAPADYLAVLRGLPDETQVALVVGHNPGAQELVADLTGQDEHLSTAAIAHVELSIEHWSELTMDSEGHLAALWRPKEQD